MRDINDETLMAYVDGELDPKAAAAIQERLATDKALQQRAHIFSASADALREVFSSELEEPVPERLSALLQPEVTPDTASNVVPLKARPASVGLRPVQLTLAASVLLVVGLVLGTQLTGHQSDAGNAAPVGGALAAKTESPAWHQGLESTPSGKSFRVGISDDVNSDVTMLSSFENFSGQYCRAYREATRDQVIHQGIACRSAAGEWSHAAVLSEAVLSEAVLSEIVLSKQGTGENTGKFTQGYQPASGAAQNAFDALLENNASTAAFPPAHVNALIRSGWQD